MVVETVRFHLAGNAVCGARLLWTCCEAQKTLLNPPCLICGRTTPDSRRIFTASGSAMLHFGVKRSTRGEAEY